MMRQQFYVCVHSEFSEMAVRRDGPFATRDEAEHQARVIESDTSADLFARVVADPPPYRRTERMYKIDRFGRPCLLRIWETQSGDAVAVSATWAADAAYLLDPLPVREDGVPFLVCVADELGETIKLASTWRDLAALCVEELGGQLRIPDRIELRRSHGGEWVVQLCDHDGNFASDSSSSEEEIRATAERLAAHYGCPISEVKP